MDKVVQLHAKNVPVANYIRLGSTAHRQLADWAIAQQVNLKRVVVDAPQVDRQSELIDVLKAQGAELVLDPKVAELGTPGGSATSARRLPWARPEGFWSPGSMSALLIKDHAARIAEFAVARGYDAVFAGTHFLDGSGENWLYKDLAACEALRVALDRQGGQRIAVDYPVVLPQLKLQDLAYVERLAYRLAQLPVDNVWLRAAGFGAGATGVAVARYLAAMNILSRIAHPLICDCVGGLVGFALCGIGPASGFSYGVAEKEHFNAIPLKKPATGRGGPGAPRVYLPQIDLHVDQRQLEALFSVRGAKSHVLCNDSLCCAHGVSDMRDGSRRHFLIQRERQVERFNLVPVHRRDEHVLKQAQVTGTTARRLERLAGLSSFPDLHKKLSKHNACRDRLTPVLMTLADKQRELGSPHAPPAASRSPASTRAVGGRVR